MTTLRNALIKTELFEGVSNELLQQILEHALPLTLEPNAVLLSPETDNHHVYILLTGELSLHFHSPDSATERKFGPGQTVGEMSIIDETKPSAYVKAQGRCQVFPVHREFLQSLIIGANPIARNMLRLLARRVKENNQRIIKDQSRISDLTNQTNVDSLTGLYNRRWLDNALPRFLTQAIKLKQPLCILMIDIDHFKQYNDTHGHLAGDIAIAYMGDVLKHKVRPYDFAVRYGGEEFMVILPHTRKNEGIKVAEYLRLETEQQIISQDNGLLAQRITISIGLAVSKVSSSTRSLIEIADQNLYLAKQNGRNCIAY